MAMQNAPFEWVARLTRLAITASLLFLALALMGAVAGAVLAIINEQGWITIAVYVLEALAAVIISIWVFVLYGLVRTLVANERAVASSAGRLGRIETLLQSQADSSKKLVERATLSDQAKSLVYRDAEIDTIRESIHEDIIRQDYGAAEALIDSIEKKLGYADIAARLREEVTASRQRTRAEQIDAAVTRIIEIVERRDWARALREAKRLLEMFPDNPKVASLPGRINKARNDHKRTLLKVYDEAVKINDIDKSIELLKELDLYLTPQEAAALEESARGVFRTKLHNLGVQFAMSVSEEQWEEALATGLQIVDEYPNSRMAHEVREKLDLLRARAAQEQTKQE
ncbi:MAG: hypothetical protein ACYTF6_08270 [Planctomycetota bacterium]|jgi:tetratricopeptide (TPR) repeat protein